MSSIANYLSNMAQSLTPQGVLNSNAVQGSTPTIDAITYSGDDTATDVAGGGVVALTGTNFNVGVTVIINGIIASTVSRISSTQITFTAPALAAGSYILYVINTNGGTAIAVPGIQYSGVPAWSTTAGTLGTLYETTAISASVAATSDSAVTYSLFSGTLPAGVTIASNGTISGTTPTVANPTTYTFVIRATDAELQDTDRTFSLTINPDIVTWSTPANNTTYSSNVGIAISTITLSSASAAGKAITYTTDALPTGISISGTSITGTPTTASSISTLLTATAATTNKTATRTIIWNILNALSSVEYLVVAGGGAGGVGDGYGIGNGGGGGAGGFRTATGFPITTGTPITVTVGGGASQTAYDTQALAGNNSAFGSIIALGGGGGGGTHGQNGYKFLATAGGSGGGGSTGAAWGAGTAGQGNHGGGNAPGGTAAIWGGGGGAGAAGNSGSGMTVLNGGIGVSSSITGTATYYAGGGGAGFSGTNAAGGGGTSGVAGTANTGGGGGQGAGYTDTGLAGGSGIVIIRYADTYPVATSVTGATYTNPTGYRVYKWTSSGSITF